MVGPAHERVWSVRLALLCGSQEQDAVAERLDCQPQRPACIIKIRVLTRKKEQEDYCWRSPCV